MLHPNADPSVLSSPNQGAHNVLEEQEDAPKLGKFKRAVAWIDSHWLQPLLVNKSQAQIKAADEVDEMIQQILEEDPLDKADARTNAQFLSISPVIRDALEKRRA